MKRWFLPMSMVLVLATSCSGQAGGEKDGHDEAHDMEFVPKVKESPSEAVDTIGFPETSTGTPITGYQGHPDDDLVRESKDDDLVNFAGGGADLDYYNGSDAGGY